MAEARVPAVNRIVIEPKSGQMTREWYFFFNQLVQLLGGEGDITTLLTSDLGSTVQDWDADLDALAALSSTGLIARTAAATYALRTLTGPASGITVSNGDGVSGNPTLALANDLSALEGLGSTGLAVRTAADTWAQRTITDGGGTFISDGDGVSGNPTIETAFQTFEVEVAFSDVESGGEKILIDAATGEQWKIRDMMISGEGTNWASGDRDLEITDGTTQWSVIPHAALNNHAAARWGDTDLPFPSTAGDMTTASASGTDIVAKYTGGATDDTAGTLVIILFAQRTA